jgi:hypothetical protein
VRALLRQSIALGYLKVEGEFSTLELTESARKVPAYVVFHDSSLAEMVREAPGTLAALAGISGVGGEKTGSPWAGHPAWCSARTICRFRASQARKNRAPCPTKANGL